jgi:hypothetical protein
MPRKTNSEDEYESRPHDDSVRAAIDAEEDALDPIDERVLDLEPEQESPFLRAQKRVPVRRGPLRNKTVHRLRIVLTAAAIVILIALPTGALYRYGRNSPRFRLESSDSIELSGNRNVTREQVLESFGPDITRNVFLIPLDERKQVTGLEPGRAGVIVAGALVLEAILALAGLSETVVSEHDLLYGIVLDAAGC